MLKTALEYRTSEENFTKNPSRIDKNNARFGRPEKNVNKKTPPTIGIMYIKSGFVLVKLKEKNYKFLFIFFFVFRSSQSFFPQYILILL